MPETPSDPTPTHPTRKTGKNARPAWMKLMLSLLVTLVIAMSIAFLSTPSLIRWNMSRWLVSSDLKHRQQALNYVARRADHQPKVRDMAIEALSVQDDVNFQQIFHALDVAGQWQQPTIPNEPWLRWLTILGSDKDPEARIMAIRQTSDLPSLSNDERLLKLFEKWLVDGNDQVRYNALIALADLSGHAKEPGKVQQLLGSMTGDALPGIAAEAWLFLGLIDPISGRAANWRQAPPEVAAAMLFANMRTNPNHPAAAIEALLDENTPASVRASAAYALHVNQSKETTQALGRTISIEDIKAQDDITDHNWIAWRSILSINDVTPLTTIEQENTAQETNRPLLWAALFNRAQQNTKAAGPQLTQSQTTQPQATQIQTPKTAAALSANLTSRLTAERLVSHPVSALAVLEGLHPNSADLGLCPADAPPYVKIAWARASATPSADHFVDTMRGLFTSDSAPVRDAACVIAWQRLDDETNLKLIASLLRDYNDNAKRSGAILAGLTNLRPTITERGVTTDLLELKMANEDIWSVQQIHRVGLWMQGRLPEMDQQIAGLMSRADLPISTMMLAMLRQQPTRAMNELFSPLTDSPTFKPESLNARSPMDHQVSLMELLVQYRWLHVLQAAVPDRELTLWLWADTGLQDFQLQIIRNHWLLNRPNADTAWTIASQSPTSAPSASPE